MEISELNRILRNKAVKHGLCDEWQQKIWNRDLSYSELLGIFIKGFDFSVKEDWLDYDFCKEVFPADELHKAHIYIDEEVDLSASESGYYVFLGKCRGRLAAGGLVAVTAYLRHQSSIDVLAADGAKVFVTCYDESNASCGSDGWSVIKKYDKTNKK